MNKILLVSLFLSLLLTGCKPEKLKLDVYTSDIKKAMQGEIVQVECVMEFMKMGENQSEMNQVEAVAEKYLNKEATFRRKTKHRKSK